MPELKLWVPTYNAERYPRETKGGEKQEFGDPHFPIVVRPAEGVRIVLGTHDYWDSTKPDLQIERRPGGWAIFLHPLGGCDASGYVYFLDDGRSYVVPERGVTPPIRMLTSKKAIREIDNLKYPPNAEDDGDSDRDRCELLSCEVCDEKREGSEDNWNGLCHACAEWFSGYVDENGLDDGDRDTAVKILRFRRRKFVERMAAWRQRIEDAEQE